MHIFCIYINIKYYIEYSLLDVDYVVPTRPIYYYLGDHFHFLFQFLYFIFYFKNINTPQIYMYIKK